MDAPLYNAEILRLAASIPLVERLAAPQATVYGLSPQATVRRVSPICGSRVTVDVILAADGRIEAFGQEVRACALGQASASILGRHVLGGTAEQLRLAHDLLKAWLKGAEPFPALLAEYFPELALLAPARAHPARHPSILLAFDTTAAAAEQAAEQTTAQTAGQALAPARGG